MIVSWVPTFLLILHSIFAVQCSPSTNTIFTESGVGHGNTYHFTVESPWRLDWTAEGEGSFMIKSRQLNGDQFLNIVGANISQPRSGSTWVYDISGPMYLQINGSNSGNVWKVEVSR